MKPDDIASAVMQPHLQGQSQRTDRIRHRQGRQAKFSLVLATAIFSSYATYTIHRYIAADKFSAISILVLVVLAAGVRSRWRST